MRLAIITTHPVQYYAPWFRFIAENTALELKVFYLWDFGVKNTHDPAFQKNFQWDIPLLDGYDHEFVPNTAAKPGTDHFFGLENPELPERVKNWNPDAVLLIGYNYSSLLKFARTWDRRKAPLLFRGDSHRLAKPRGGIKHLLKYWMLRFFYSRFAAFLPVGGANADYFRLHGVPDRKLFLAPHAIENARFESGAKKEDRIRLREEWKIPEAHVVFLFVGKLEQKKRPQDLLEAFSRLPQDNVALVFSGSGELEDALRNRAAQITNPVRFLGFQNQSAMPGIYAACDVLVLPSQGAYETWGLAVNEAMVCGLPAIVSSHVGCAQDLVLPHETGWQFPAGNVDALFSCLQDAGTHAAQRIKYGEQARDRVLGHYSYQAATDGLLRALKSISSS